MKAADTHPQATELYFASLIATALVYGAGAVIFLTISYFGQQTGGWDAVLRTALFLTFFGTIAAAAIGLMITGPLGTGIGLTVLRATPPGWWQGPITGALVAITVEAFVILIVSRERLDWEAGNAITLSIPILLAMIAGAIVQRRVLSWPARSRAGSITDGLS